MATAQLVRGGQVHQNYLGAQVTATSPGAQALVAGLEAHFQAAGASAANAHQQALGALYRSLLQQSSLLAYADNFEWLGFLGLCCIPLALLLTRLRTRRDEAADAVPE
ncbi:MAG: hypothetical protein WCE75_10040 [Terracidiphilus sp.]